MSQATISIRVDQSLKNKFDLLCEAFGLSATAAFNIFMRTVVREKRIPFEIRADNTDVVRQKALKAFESMRKTVEESSHSDMTLEEINNEIKNVRNERGEKGLRSN
ncbi:MAG: type II toxin-antitoxin system RelB/DinJ family antitoxin [Muribaculaceae bacterium]|nr:type II toxin-antitoxin system RelB/DinJ family antitoxin [Muribaculaceae bacterium]MDE6683068.1 type II toxin-antitoxin system RelB/DinJ family antitoxin [Muribaculaceae bacterium]